MTASEPIAGSREMDLIDRIAEALPLDIRADYYRELRHCRSLPDNDEMLRILRIMQFLTVLIYQVPERIVSEREQLDSNLQSCTEALQTVESRLHALPQGVASSISPQKIAAQINETLRQLFLQTTIPQTSDALNVAAETFKKSMVEFVEAAKQISIRHRSAAEEAREAIAKIDSSVRSAVRTAEQATESFYRSAKRFHWGALTFGGIILFLSGYVTCLLTQR